MRSLRLLRFLLFIPLLAGCGLPDSYYLQQPNVQNVASTVSTSFEFFNPDHSNDLSVAFQGFDLYYQFYSNLQSINQNAYDATDINDPPHQLAAKGFFPICRGAGTAQDSPPSRTSPTIIVDPAVRLESFPIDIFINSGTFPNYLSYSTYVPPSTGTAVTDEIRRNAPDLTSGYGYKSFAGNSARIINPPNYGSDNDMSAALFVACGGTAYLAMYAMSYGVASDGPHWSIPVYLGYLQITIQ